MQRVKKFDEFKFRSKRTYFDDNVCATKSPIVGQPLFVQTDRRLCFSHTGNG